MKITIIPVTQFEQNCSLLVCEETRHAAIVDPGGDLERIMAVVAQQGVTVEKIFLTHGHVDHCSGAAALAAQLQVPIEGPHEAEKFWIDLLPMQSVQFGFPPAQAFTPDRWLKDGDTVKFGAQTLKVFHCPGHTPGHVVFFHETDRMAVVGDVIFSGSIGRTDFPKGNHMDLINAIRDKLFPLGDDVTFIPGHGPTSTFGEERDSNPHVADYLFAKRN